MAGCAPLCVFPAKDGGKLKKKLLEKAAQLLVFSLPWLAAKILKEKMVS